MIGIFLEITISGYGNSIGYDQKPHLMSVSGRILSCPIPEHYINMFKTPFEAFGQILTKLLQPLSSKVELRSKSQV